MTGKEDHLFSLREGLDHLAGRSLTLFIEINQGLEHTEKFYPQLLNQDHRDKLDWNFWHDDKMSPGHANMVKPEGWKFEGQGH